jgi:hypothetical protein
MYFADMRSRNFTAWLLFACLLIPLAGCSLFPSQKALKQCRFEAVGFEFSGLSPQGIEGRLRVQAVNPSRHLAKLHRMDLRLLYVVEHGTDTLAQVRNDSLIHLPAGDTLILPLRMTLPLKALSTLAAPLASGSVIDCLLLGDAHIDTPLGDYTVRKAINRKMPIDLSLARGRMLDALGAPWLRGLFQ